jgi:hypothetical protein
VGGVALRRHQGLVKAAVLLLGHGAVEVVGALVVAPGAEALGEVNALVEDDGAGGVVVGEEVVAKAPFQGFGQGLRGEGPRGQNREALGDLPDLLPHHLEEGVGLKPLGDEPGEDLPVHGQGPTGGHPGHLRRLHDQASRKAHLRLKEALGVGLPLPAQGVGADDLGEEVGGVGRGHALRAHLKKPHRHAHAKKGPGGLAPREAPAHHVHPFHPLDGSTGRAFGKV